MEEKDSVSLCMIVKDEERLLGSLLSRIKVDEIFIVDTGSVDYSLRIAKKFTDNVHSYRWQDDFSKARNYSISKATKDWILILDADERLSKKDLIRLRSIIKNSPKDILGYRFIQKTYHGRKVVSIRGICRLFRNKKSIRFVYPIHETVRESIKEKGGRIGKTGIIIKHYSSLNQKKTDYYLRLLKQKLQTHPGSSAQKEIELENKLATLH